MMLDALTQGTSRSDVNDYKALKDAMNSTSGQKQTALNSFLTGVGASSMEDLIEKFKAAQAEDATNGNTAKYDALKALCDSKQKLAPGATTPIEGYSSNIYDKKDGTQNEIFEAAANDPVASGILDALKISLALDKMQIEYGATDGLPTGRAYYYITLTTTGYYRKNIVAVQDSLYNISGSVTNNVHPEFDSFWKSTGGANADPKGDRAVVIASVEISDNAYFENTYTIFGKISGGSNKFQGGVTSTGSIFFIEDFQAHIPKPGYVWDKSGNQVAMANARHDWVVNGDLGIMANNSGTLDLNGNNLYVNGNLIIGNQDKGVKAHNVYVNGNIYFTNGSGKITLTDTSGNYVAPGSAGAGALYCAGNIYCEDMNAMSLKNADGSYNSSWAAKYGTSWNTVQDEYDAIIDKANKATKEITGGNIGNAGVSSGDYDGIKGRVNNGNTTLYCSGTISSRFGTQLTSQGTYDPSSESVTTSTVVRTSDNQSYMFQDATMTVDKMFSSSGLTAPGDWPQYEADSDCTSNVLTIDFAGIESYLSNPEGPGLPPPAEKTFTSTKGDVVASVSKSSGHYVVDIPATANGYALQLLNAQEFSYAGWNDAIYYNIHTVAGASMPIVLKGNYNDGSPTASNADGFNAFSWTGGAAAWDGTVKSVGHNGPVVIQLVDDTGSSTDGNVVFVMEETGSDDAVTYHSGEWQIMGTKSQIDQIDPFSNKENIGAPTAIESMFGSNPNGSDPQPAFDNRIMIMSSKNTSAMNFTGDTKNTKAAFVSDDDNGHDLICGYLYCPNGMYGNKNGNSRIPVFGGLIVSEYVAGMADYRYAEPNPSIVDSMFDKVKPKGTSGSSEVEGGAWFFDGANIGRNFLG